MMEEMAAVRHCEVVVDHLDRVVEGRRVERTEMPGVLRIREAELVLGSLVLVDERTYSVWDPWLRMEYM